jgi:hypothetical protein
MLFIYGEESYCIDGIFLLLDYHRLTVLLYRAYLGHLLGVRGGTSLHLIQLTDLLKYIHEEGVNRRNPCLIRQQSCANPRHVQGLVPESHLSNQKTNDSDAYYDDVIPHDEASFMQATVNAIISTALRFPQPWRTTWQWSREMHVTLSRQYQPSIRNAPVLHSFILPLSIVCALWLNVILWLWFSLTRNVPSSIRRYMIEGVDGENTRLMLFLNIQHSLHDTIAIDSHNCGQEGDCLIATE